LLRIEKGFSLSVKPKNEAGLTVSRSERGKNKHLALYGRFFFPKANPHLKVTRYRKIEYKDINLSLYQD